MYFFIVLNGTNLVVIMPQSPEVGRHSYSSRTCVHKGRTQRWSPVHSTESRSGPLVDFGASPSESKFLCSRHTSSPPFQLLSVSGESDCNRLLGYHIRSQPSQLWTGFDAHGHILLWMCAGCQRCTFYQGQCFRWGRGKPDDPWSHGYIASSQSLLQCRTWRVKFNCVKLISLWFICLMYWSIMEPIRFLYSRCCEYTQTRKYANPYIKMTLS